MRCLWASAGAVFLVDQASKFAVVHGLNLDQRRAIDVWPPFLNFRMAWNEGVNFGLFASSQSFMRWFLVALALAIATWVWLWLRRGHHTRLAHLGGGMLIGGALGNVVDRLLYGAVADFLNMSCCGIDNPYSFNIADIAIFAGALLLVVVSDRQKTP